MHKGWKPLETLMILKRLLPKTVVMAFVLCVSINSLALAQTKDELYEAAKSEGKLVLWSPFDPNAVRIIAQAFEADYPGVELQSFELQPGAAVQRIIAEAQAGQVNYDLVDVTVPFVKPLLDRDVLESADWGKVKSDSVRALYDSKCTGYYHVELPIAYNTALVRKGEIKGWDDLLDPEWKGKVALEARGYGLSILLQEWGKEKTGAFIDGLKANGAIIMRGGTSTAEALAGGQAAIAIGTYIGKVIQYKEMGAPVDWARVGPISAQDHLLCMPRKAAHPNAGRLFALWAGTKAGLRALWEGQRYGLIAGSALSPTGEEFKNANIAFVMEDLDPATTQQNQAWVAARIGGF